ncbi:hypothetical protein [Flavobacterium cerinum]|uniref:Uncharacterized protein n=1 Tax=Flavobacterium cerinum TaxID=2502784 RepID=A0ABY5ITU1_9FLAO|nr:hypothetical protein [Flavobacterium cerinum]UUC46079.1 hypothetical protein NOX80_02470 [Flavobacterium cerinum]
MKFKKLLLGLAVFATILYSCSSESSSDSSSSPTTVAEDKQNISNTFDSFYNCLNTLDDGELSNFLLYSLFNSGNQEYNDSWIKSISNKFEAQYGKVFINNKLQFANRAGVYVWNPTSQNWTKQSSSNIVTLKFPSRQNQTENDAEFSLNSYNDTSVSYTSETYWLPTQVNLTLKRNNNLVFSLNASNITFDVNTNFSMPTNADVVIYTAPYTHNFSWRRNSAVDFQLTYNSATPQGCTNAIVTNVKLKHSDYGNITSVSDVKTVNGNVAVGNLKIVYAANVEAITAYDNPTPAQINNNTNAEVYYNNFKIGNLIYDEVNGVSKFYIVYSDGSRENVDVYVADFETKIRSIFANYL